MKSSFNGAIAAIALSTIIAGCATTGTPTQSLRSSVQSAVGPEGQVQVTLNNRVATLTGYVRSSYTERRVIQAASKHPDVDRVVDLILAN